MSFLADEESSSDESAHRESLKINEKFAGKWERQERLKDLRRAAERGELEDSDESESESEDEDAELLSTRLDLQIANTIKSLRKKDPKIYDPKAKFFVEPESSGDDEDEKEEQGPAVSNKKKKYKDVLREQLMKHGADIEEEDGESAERSRAMRKSKSSNLNYDAEQERIRQQFLQSAGGADSDSDGEEAQEGAMGIVKAKGRAAVYSDDDEAVAEVAAQETWRELGEAVSESGAGDEAGAEAFLTQYMLKKGWKDTGAGKLGAASRNGPSAAEEEYDYEDEEALLDTVDRFESKYNFRFEEMQDENEVSGAGLRGAGEEVQVRGHARVTADSLRQQDDKRKRERAARKERKEHERRVKEAEIRRLKNVKRQELQERLKQIGDIGGLGKKAGALVLDEDALDEDWDPEKHEALMRSQFGEDYYDAEDDDFQGGLGAGFDEDTQYNVLEGERGDDLAGGDWDYNDDDYNEAEGEEGEEGDARGSVEAAKKRKKQLKQSKQALEEELYALDYEDLIAGMPCRFKYRQVEPEDYGLTAEEILLAEDAELNQYVSLKHLAPYRLGNAGNSDGLKKKRKRLRATLRERMAAQQEQEEKQHSKQGQKTEDEESMEVGQKQEKAEVDVPAPEEGGKKKRRRNKKKSSAVPASLVVDPEEVDAGAVAILSRDGESAPAEAKSTGKSGSSSSSSSKSSNKSKHAGGSKRGSRGGNSSSIKPVDKTKARLNLYK